MAQRHRVRCIVRSEQGDSSTRIAAIGGLNLNNTRWQVSVAEAIAGIEARQWVFYIIVHGRQVDLVIDERDGQRYLRARNDGIEPLHLLRLPDCPS